MALFVPDGKNTVGSAVRGILFRSPQSPALANIKQISPRRMRKDVEAPRVNPFEQVTTQRAKSTDGQTLRYRYTNDVIQRLTICNTAVVFLSILLGRSRIYLPCSLAVSRWFMYCGQRLRIWSRSSKYVILWRTKSFVLRLSPVYKGFQKSPHMRQQRPTKQKSACEWVPYVCG